MMDDLTEPQRLDSESYLLDPVSRAKALYAIEERAKDSAHRLEAIEELLTELPRYAEEAREARLTMLHVANQQTEALDSIRRMLKSIIVILVVLGIALLIWR